MKITLIHGQNHKGSTYAVSRKMAEKTGGELEEFFLPKDFDERCLGCLTCMNKSIELCPHYGTLEKILKSMLSSEVIIINSPTYCMEMSGQLKSLFDHLFTLWLSHRPEQTMFSKTAIAISTAAGAGMKGVTKSIKRQLFFWGIPKIYKIPLRVSAASWETVSAKKKAFIEKKTSKIAAAIKKKNGKAKPCLKLKFMFAVMRSMHKNNDWSPACKDYWVKNGWLDKVRPWKNNK